jgi:hypothetical protein
MIDEQEAEALVNKDKIINQQIKVIIKGIGISIIVNSL